MSTRSSHAAFIHELDAGDRSLKASIRQYRRMVQTVEDGVMVLDADNVLVFVNQELADMLGYSTDVLVGAPLTTFLLDDQAANAAPGRRPRLSVSEESEIKLQAADGTCRWALVRSIPLFDGQGHFCGVRARVSDMTALKQAEAEVARLKDQLDNRRALFEHEVEERSHIEEFVATVSHEFRTPLTSVRGYIDLMLSDPDLPREQQERYLNRLLANAEHLANLLNSLLDLSRIAEGHLQLTLEPISIQEKLDQLNEAMAPQFSERGVSFKIELQDGGFDRSALVTDGECLTRVLSNLLSNGCKYTPAGGQVTLRVEADPESVWFTVADTGVGIPAIEQDRIFSKFYRGSNTRRLGSRGTGLGLTITKSLVELLGGEIGFVSQEGVGTVFRLSLPVVPH